MAGSEPEAQLTTTMNFQRFMISRTNMAPELAEFNLDRRNIRLAAFNTSGNDVRLITPGQDWGLVREKRKEIAADFMERVQEVFDDIFEKISGGKRTSLDNHLLPTIKTPAVRKVQSRLHPKEVADPDLEHPHESQAMEFDEEDCGSKNDKVIHSITNICRTTRSRAKQEEGDKGASATASKCTARECPQKQNISQEDYHVDSGRTSNHITSVSQSRDPVPTSTSRCTVRERTSTRKPHPANKVESDSENVLQTASDKTERMESTEPDHALSTASRRVTRALTRRTETGVQPQLGMVSPSSARATTTEIKQLESLVSCDDPTSTSGTEDEDTTTSRRRVSAYTRKLQSASKPYNDSQTVFQTVSGKSREADHMESTDSEADHAPSTASRRVTRSCTRRMDTGVQSQLELVSSSTRATTPTLPAEIKQLEPLASCDNPTSTSGTEDEGSSQLPLPRKALKLKKRARQTRKGKKGQTRTATPSTVEDDENREQIRTATPGAVEEEDDKMGQAKTAIPGGEDNGGTETMNKDVEEQSAVPEPTTGRMDALIPINSADSLYQSCVSDMEVGSPMMTRSQKTTTCIKPSRIPIPVKTPPNGSVPLHAGPVSRTITKAGNPPSSGATCTESRPDISPTSVHYLTGTPRTQVRKLQEQHRQLGSNAGGNRVISVSELMASHSRIPTPTTITKPRSIVTSLTGGKRLRSVSLEKLPCSIKPKRPSNGLCPQSDGKVKRGSTESSSSSQSTYAETECRSQDGHTPDSVGSSESDLQGSFQTTPFKEGIGDSESSPAKMHELTKTKTSKKNILRNIFGRKGEWSAMKVTSNGTLPISFLPRNSPKIQDTHESRKQRLMERIKKKEEEEERRKKELEQKREFERQEKIRKREERAKRVAEKQAALQQEENNKRNRVHGVKSHDQQLNKERNVQKKTTEIDEKNRKQREHFQAVESRRRQEEEQKRKRLQQMEEDRRIAEELIKKRLAQEEEEKRVKREEKRKVDQERKLQRDHADREKLQVQQQGGMSMSAPKTAKKDVDKTRFEQLLTTTSANRFVQHWKQLNGKQMSPSEHQHGSNASYLYSTVTNSQSSPKLQHYEEASTLNCTFTKDCTDGGRDTKVHLTTPAQSSKHPHVQNLTNSKYTTASSYEMTPVGQDPLLVTYKNYDIDDLSSEDSTDDESCPKKPIPLWARPSVLNEVMLAQEEGVNCKSVDIDKIFPPEQLLKVPDLAKIFKVKRKRFYCRSSSAQWDSPMFKKTRIE